MWAFRYALGRRTGAVDSVVTHLRRHWGVLEGFTRQQIKNEIKVAIERDWAGNDCDVEEWQKVLKFKVKENLKVSNK